MYSNKILNFQGSTTILNAYKKCLLWYYLTQRWEDKEVPEGIFLKKNVIARLEFELAYYDSAVQ